MSTDEQIEDLIYNNAPSFEIAKVLKADIKEYYSTLEKVFEESSGKAFLVTHTKKIDTIIAHAYKAVKREMFREYQPLTNSIPVTLVALGSYGREQMSVRSDIDIMLVYKDIGGFNAKAIIEKILYLLWDCGLKIGHRVHEVGELFEVAHSDITIKSAIMESRFIDGSKYLWTSITNQITKIINHEQKEYILAKVDEINNLHAKNPLNMEPNLKDGVGGFRDANLVFWIGKTLYNVPNIKHLPAHIVEEQDYKEFRIALELLFRVRSALHIVLNKKDDKLRLEYIPSITRMLGYEDDYNQHMRFLAQVLGSLRRVHLYSMIWVDKMLQTLSLNQEIDHPLYSIHPQSMQEALQALKKVQKIETIPPKFIKAMIDTKEGLALDKAYYDDVKALFYHPNCYLVFELFVDAIMLSYIIPSFKKMVNLPQFDGYHQHTVGVHSIQTLYYMENISDPLLHSLFAALSPDEQALLKVVALMHDVGKGRERDHSIVGAELFRSYAKELGFDEELIEYGSRLILNHTLMSRVAQKEDLYNHTTIYKFVNVFDSKKLLDMIYLLTYADMSGVGKDIYNNFTAKLIHTLYNLSLDAMDDDERINDMSKRVRKEKSLQKSERFLALPKRIQKKVLSIEADLLFLKYTKAQILEIVERSMSSGQDWFNIDRSQGFLALEVMRNENLNINYLLNKLGYLKLKNMDIFKLYEGKKYFKFEFAQNVMDDELPRIEAIIEKALSITEIKQLWAIRLHREEIVIDCEHSHNYATMHIKCRDQDGLVSYLMGIFDKLGVDIVSAKIYTHKNRVEDLFLIERNGNFCSNQELIISQLENKGEE
ncbi:MAG: HD domain-containing protein [Campylobacterales bacterium]|nr:HD domain-containing protein [Campylobacterales bacterium]